MRSRRPGRWRARLLALSIAYVVIEILLMPLLAALAPLKVSARLPAPLYVLGESSKAGFLPRDWVLVLGDSFAGGYGDWLTEALRQEGRPPFQATHVLHELTGRDVLSFGTGGADNVSSSAYLASKRFAALRRVGLTDPSDVLVYFYEGNDLNDNLRLMRRRFELAQRGPEGYSDEDLDRLIRRRARAGFWEGLPGMLYAPYSVLNLLGGKLQGGMSGEGRSELDVQAGPPGTIPEENGFVVGELSAHLPGSGRGPGLDLSAPETELALRLLERSLRWTRARFDEARVTLVYLPAPMSCYEFVSPKVRVRSYEGRGELYDPRAALERSDELRRRAETNAAAVGVGWIDATPRLRAAARSQLLHGPGDFGHLNRAGYTLLGEILAQGLAASGR